MLFLTYDICRVPCDCENRGDLWKKESSEALDSKGVNIEIGHDVDHKQVLCNSVNRSAKQGYIWMKTFDDDR